VKLTTHLHLLPRLRMSGAIPLLPLLPLWRRQDLKGSAELESFLDLRKGCVARNITQVEFYVKLEFP
jgi:hypothetical protein